MTDEPPTLEAIQGQRDAALRVLGDRRRTDEIREWLADREAKLLEESARLPVRRYTPMHQACGHIGWLLERDAAREKRLAEVEAELAGIRERARAELTRTSDAWLRTSKEMIFERVVGDLGEPAATEGGSDG